MKSVPWWTANLNKYEEKNKRIKKTIAENQEGGGTEGKKEKKIFGGEEKSIKMKLKKKNLTRGRSIAALRPL